MKRSTTMRNMLIAALMALPLAGQTSNAKISAEPPPIAVEKQFFYDGSNNLTYVCFAKQNNVTTAWRRSKPSREAPSRSRASSCSTSTCRA